jgi:serine/threonine protein kinase
MFENLIISMLRPEHGFTLTSNLHETDNSLIYFGYQNREQRIFKFLSTDDEVVHIRKKIAKLGVGPKLYNIFAEDDRFVFVMEYKTDYLSLEQSKSDIMLRKRIIRGVAGRLKLLHDRDIIHGDVKSSNIILNGDLSVTLIDFDTAMYEKEMLTEDIGTVGFQAPELLRKEIPPLTRKIDVWSLGVFLIQLIFNIEEGEMDDRPNTSKYVSRCKHDIEAEFLKMLCTPDPKLRPSIDKVLAHPYLKNIDTSNHKVLIPHQSEMFLPEHSIVL